MELKRPEGACGCLRTAVSRSPGSRSQVRDLGPSAPTSQTLRPLQTPSTTLDSQPLRPCRAQPPTSRPPWKPSASPDSPAPELPDHPPRLPQHAGYADPQDPESTGTSVTCGEAVRLARRCDAQGQALGLGGLHSSPPPPPPQQRRRCSPEEGRGPDPRLGKPDSRGLGSCREPGHAQRTPGARTALGGRRSQQG